jgi:OmpA-OmpF porin, OOP family
MNIARALGIASLAALTLTAGGMAAAEDAGWYTGFNAGQSRAKIDDQRIADGLAADGFDTTSIYNGDRHFAFKVYGGYSFNRYIALETGYFNLGKFGFTADTVPAGSLRGQIKVQGLNTDVVGSIPIGDKFSLFARAGLNYAQAKDSYSGTGLVVVTDPQTRKTEPNYKFGFGAEYDFTRHFGMRIEAERYRIDDAAGNKGDIDLFSGGLIFRFGEWESPAPPPIVPPPAAPEPERALPPPPPPPPPPPVRRRVSFSADSLFDFGKDTVKATGRLALDRFAADVKGTQFDVITVTGYTDRIGSHDYNLKLSARRAESVKSYLVNTSGIPDGKVTTRGADGEDPVTKPDECPGEKRTPQLIACLQPDRRVDVEVVGTKLQPAP